MSKRQQWGKEWKYYTEDWQIAGYGPSLLSTHIEVNLANMSKNSSPATIREARQRYPPQDRHDTQPEGYPQFSWQSSDHHAAHRRYPEEGIAVQKADIRRRISQLGHELDRIQVFELSITPIRKVDWSIYHWSPLVRSSTLSQHWQQDIQGKTSIPLAVEVCAIPICITRCNKRKLAICLWEVERAQFPGRTQARHTLFLVGEIMPGIAYEGETKLGI